ncbi:GNAT family N-acetyltransferase [Clostridium felsineum]|uniref:Uncharacterized protein n=1 Tax=Clostridium felsineum TaxID=36839 RepID=A0A1S8MER8_9CLOT|nr:GNAT family N-acetyltransferase [Clostridium felsineum]MCR3761033.1 GNAT family N-acetyltransferase [Clostridium felsineum]URZ07447.1 hypothetical protein CLROS_027850 [Clostridium felsineum]URZ12478.1 hypothetical protein CROST_032000 [Clostridium felsineum]
MIFKGKDFYVDLLEDEDLKEVVLVYNSNKNFLMKHIGKGSVTEEWILGEIKCMRELHFYPCKIVDKANMKLVGVMDFKIDKESYLSLLMLNSTYKNRGLGKLVYEGFEKYVKEKGSLGIRIDVVCEYDNKVLSFWKRNGFMEIENVKLKWTSKALPAVVMRKSFDASMHF